MPEVRITTRLGEAEVTVTAVDRDPGDIGALLDEAAAGIRRAWRTDPLPTDEGLARALFDAEGLDGPGPSWDETTKDVRESYRHLAAAALDHLHITPETEETA